MTWEWLALAGLAVVALSLLVALVATRRGTGRQIEAARAEAAALRERLDRLEEQRHRPEPVARTEPEFRITEVGRAQPQPEDPPVRLEGAVFADHVLREGVIRVGSLVHGVRRALDAETRNRIRFEMRREVKRARRERRTEQREAYREWQARQRRDVPDDGRDDPFPETA